MLFSLGPYEFVGRFHNSVRRIKHWRDESKYCIFPGYRHRASERYFDDTPFADQYQREVYEFAADFAKKMSLRRIYDVGCGSGYKLIKYFADYHAVGFDLEPTVHFLRARYPEREWQVCGLGCDALSRADLVICADVVEHVLDPSSVMEFIDRLATRYIILSTPDRDLMYPPGSGYRHGPPSNRTHVREWNYREFERYVSSYFEVLDHRITNYVQGTQMVLCMR